MYASGDDRDLTAVPANLTLVSVDGPHAAIVDCGGLGRFLEVLPGLAGEVVLDGLCVRNGAALAGGGVRASGARLVVRRCLFEQCIADEGGAIDASGADLVVVASRFLENTASTGGGGALRVAPAAPDELVRVTECEFLANEAHLLGGALFVDAGLTSGAMTFHVSGCTFVANQALVGAGGAQAAPRPGGVAFEKIEIPLDDGARHVFLESLTPPPGVRPPPPPTLIVLHDHGATPERTRAALGFDLAGQGWAVLYPRSWDASWNVGRKTLEGGFEKGRDDVAYILAAIRLLAEQGRVDATRLFLVGFGEGAQMAMRLSCDAPVPWRGLAAVMGTWPVGLFCGRRDPLPMIFFHADKDPAFPFHGGRVRPELRVGTGAAASVSRTITIAAARNGCEGYSETRLTRDPSAKLRVRQRFHNCREPLIQVIIEGAGHHWPGGPAPSRRALAKYGPAAPEPDATRMITDLFLSLAKRKAP